MRLTRGSYFLSVLDSAAKSGFTFSPIELSCLDLLWVRHACLPRASRVSSGRGQGKKLGGLGGDRTVERLESGFQDVFFGTLFGGPAHICLAVQIIRRVKHTIVLTFIRTNQYSPTRNDYSLVSASKHIMQRLLQCKTGIHLYT